MRKRMIAQTTDNIPQIISKIVGISVGLSSQRLHKNTLRDVQNRALVFFTIYMLVLSTFTIVNQRRKPNQ